MITYVYPEIDRALIAVLRAAGVEAILPTEDRCCGIPLLMHGDEAGAGAMARVRATYHDPCHLARGQGVRSQPRDLITRVAGLELAELGSPETCCGGAGSFLLTHPELAARIGARKTAEIDATGAEIVVTSCPGCRMQLTGSLRRRERTHEVRHTVEILAEAIVVAE